MTASRSVFLVLALGALVLGSPAALGEDEPPPFGASDLAIEEEGVQEPWELVYEELEGTPGEGLELWATMVARASNVSEDDLFFETRILKGPEGMAATLLVIEIEGDPGGLPKSLEERGKAAGYLVRPLGHPTRLLVLAAPEGARKTLLDMQIGYSVQTLSRLGWERLRSGSLVGAAAYAKGGRALDKKAGSPLVVLGMVATKEEKWDDAIEAFRIGFGKSATNRAAGRLAMRGYAHYGYACLQKKNAEMDREGREALEKCVALESHADPKEDPTFVQRYNLACAHSRLNEADPALRQLAKALELAKVKFDAVHLKAWIENTVLKDEDFDNIKDSAGFKAVIQKALGEGGAPSSGL